MQDSKSKGSSPPTKKEEEEENLNFLIPERSEHKVFLWVTADNCSTRLSLFVWTEVWQAWPDDDTGTPSLHILCHSFTSCVVRLKVSYIRSVATKRVKHQCVFNKYLLETQHKTATETHCSMRWHQTFTLSTSSRASAGCDSELLLICNKIVTMTSVMMHHFAKKQQKAMETTTQWMNIE